MVPFHSCIYVTWEAVRREEILKPSYLGEHNFYGMQLTTLDIMLTIFSLVIFLWLIDDINHHIYLFVTLQVTLQLTSSTKSSPKNGKFFCLKQTVKIKVIDSSSSENKLYWTFVVYSMASYFALISDKHKIKTARKERIPLQIAHINVVLRRKFYIFLTIWVVFTFPGCLNSQLSNTIS